MTNEQTADVMKLILAAWSSHRQRMSNDDVKAMYAAYASGLIDLEYDVVRAAISRVVRTSKFLPTVAEIREAAGVVVYGDQTTGIEAWGAVLKAIKNCGSHRRPGTKEQCECGEADFWFKDPITAKVTTAMNWTELCAGDHITMTSNRARFIDAYEELARNQRVNTLAATGLTAPALTGGHEPSMPTIEIRRTPLVLASPDERSSMLRDVLETARHEQPERCGSLVNSVLKTYVTPDDDHAEVDGEDVH